MTRWLCFHTIRFPGYFWEASSPLCLTACDNESRRDRGAGVEEEEEVQEVEVGEVEEEEEVWS